MKSWCSSRKPEHRSQPIKELILKLEIRTLIFVVVFAAIKVPLSLAA